MLKDKDNQLSIYSILYNKVPENHTLKLINSAIDLNFVTNLLEESYSRKHGRPAKDPELMIRLLILQHLYNLCDVKIIEEASLNLAYMWFLDINPGEDLSDPSLLAKFRVHRLQDLTLNEIIVEVVRQCVEKGILKDTGISIDATHTAANTFKATPERVMKCLANKIFKAYEGECISGNNIGRVLEVGLNAPEYYSYSQEGKNGEMKNYHGLSRARGYGKRSMSTQAKLTALAVNLKRIASILSSKTPKFFNVIRFYLRFYRNVVILG